MSYIPLQRSLKMIPLKIGINGMGRIGRTILRQFLQNPRNIQIKAVNTYSHLEQFIHLLKYDSIYGDSLKDIYCSKNSIIIQNHEISFYSEKDPHLIPWSDHDIDIVIDATGVFKTKKELSQHLGVTVKKVILCMPGKDLDGIFVVGINLDTYRPDKHHIISNASCTTNCLAPLAKVLHENFTIQSGLMTTIHSYTSDQALLDSSHSDPRRARAAALSMIPTTTGAALTLGKVIPELEGKINGYAIRIPTPNVSLVDLTVSFQNPIGAVEINKVLEEASKTSLQNILSYEEEKLVSIDYKCMKASSCVDASLTMSLGNTAKVISWYDNETGFSNRILDLASFIGKKMQ